MGVAVAAAPASAGFAFLVAGLAQDKTQAFAFMKIFGIAPMIPTAAWFVAEPLQWVAGLHPSYWASKAYWVAEGGSATWPALDTGRRGRLRCLDHGAGAVLRAGSSALTGDVRHRMVAWKVVLTWSELRGTPGVTGSVGRGVILSTCSSTC